MSSCSGILGHHAVGLQRPDPIFWRVRLKGWLLGSQIPSVWSLCLKKWHGTSSQGISAILQALLTERCPRSSLPDSPQLSSLSDRMLYRKDNLVYQVFPASRTKRPHVFTKVKKKNNQNPLQL